MMKSRTYVWISILLIAYIASLGVYASRRQTVPQRLNSDDPSLVSAGKTVYASYCAACHGAQLEGQPDWRRPGPDGTCRRRLTTRVGTPGTTPTTT